MSLEYHEISVDGKILDVSENDLEAISIDYSIQDNNDFTAIRAARSRTVKFPATKNNIAAYDRQMNPELAGVTPEFKPGSIYANGVPIIQGFTQRIRSTSIGGPETIEAAFWGDNANWFQAIRQKRMKDLAFVNVIMCGDQAALSWAGSYDTGWEWVAYPVNYGEWLDMNNQRIASEANIDYTPRGIEDTDLRPHLYIKTIIDKIFEGTGYTLESTFFNTPFFKKLTYLWHYGSVNKLTSKFDFVKREKSTTEQWPASYSNHNPAVGNNHYHWFNLDYNYIQPGEYIFQLSGLAQNTGHNNSVIFSCCVGYKDVNNNISILAEATPNATGAAAFDAQIFRVELDCSYQPGKFVFGIRSQFPMPGSGDFDITTNVNIALTTNVSMTMKYVAGQAISWYEVLPETPVSEFLKGLSGTFGLKWFTDETNRKIYVEPRDFLGCPYAVYTPFYLRNNWKDYTEKRDLQKPYVYYTEDLGKYLTIRWKDTDEVNYKGLSEGRDLKLYEARYATGVTLNNDVKDYSNTYFTGVAHIRDRFVRYSGTQSPGVTLPPLPPGFKPNTTENAQKHPYMPCVWRALPDADLEQVYPSQDFSCDPAIIYYEGLVTNRHEMIYKGAFYKNNLNQGVYPLAYQVYYHDSATVNTPCLSFADVTYNIVAPPVGRTVKMRGLFSCFHTAAFAAIKNNRYVEMNVNFKAQDINTLDFRVLWKENNDQFILNEVKGYKPFKRESTLARVQQDVFMSETDFITNVQHSNLRGLV